MCLKTQKFLILLSFLLFPVSYRHDSAFRNKTECFETHLLRIIRMHLAAYSFEVFSTKVFSGSVLGEEFFLLCSICFVFFISNLFLDLLSPCPLGAKAQAHIGLIYNS